MARGTVQATAVCSLCRSGHVEILLDLGYQPMTNRFLSQSVQDDLTHPMIIGQCADCGVVQLVEPAPVEKLTAPYDWITYNEAEGHLDRVAEAVLDLPGAASDSRICGISYKDDSLLERLRTRGFHESWRIDEAHDIGITDGRAGLETIQDRLTPAVAEELVRAHGPADIVIARHILEHAHDPLRFMQALGALVRADGYVILEVPDCTRALEALDYTTLWEEHILYFTPATFERALAHGGFTLLDLACYPYTHENSLVAIAQRRELTSGRTTSSSESGLQEESRRARAFALGFQPRRARAKAVLQDAQRAGRVALLGAGHLACAFINLFDLSGDLAFVVDDNPHKRGLRMPGSRLPIRGSDALIQEGVTLCLLSVNPEVELRVLERNQAFLAGGGTFASIFPTSSLAFFGDATDRLKHEASQP